MRRTFKPAITRPEDFDAFWDSTRKQLWEIDPECVRRRDTIIKNSPVHVDIASFTSLGRVRVSAYLLYWKDDIPRPLVISSHGYGSQCQPRHEWANEGVNVLSVDIRGFGISRDALPRPSRWGYVVTGIESPETSVIRFAVCDYMQAARVALALLEGRVSSLVFEGVSFAGGLALMAQAITGQAGLLAVGVPTFGWAEGRNLFVKAGSGAEIARYVANRPDQFEDTMVVLRYFDTVNFADRIHCPTLLALGLEDHVVPAKTVYGIANHLVARHEIIEFPVSHTDGPEHEHWERFERYWLQLATQGVPDSFGTAR